MRRTEAILLLARLSLGPTVRGDDATKKARLEDLCIGDI